MFILLLNNLLSSEEDTFSFQLWSIKKKVEELSVRVLKKSWRYALALNNATIFETVVNGVETWKHADMHLPEFKWKYQTFFKMMH